MLFMIILVWTAHTQKCGFLMTLTFDKGITHDTFDKGITHDLIRVFSSKESLVNKFVSEAAITRATQ